MKHLNLWAALGVAVTLTSLAIAQEAGGTFSGRVVDPTGAGVPGAEVLAVHTGTGVSHKATSGSEGAYALPNLPIGAYDISVTRAGFKRTVRKGIELHVSEHLGVELPLQIGELAQEVSVTANVEQVQTESSAQGGLITGDQVRELQLNGRGFMTLLELVPGVASDNPDRNDPISPTLSMSVNGARTSQIGFGVDGSSNPGVIGSSAIFSSTSPESIAEFTVLSSTFSAEYGRGGIAQVNVVTKSGTRQLHGSLYEFLRNDAFDANDYFSHQVLPLRLNNFGYTVGGPVILPRYNRDASKTFFFVTQEWNRVSSQLSAKNTTVPSVAQRAGDFSALGTAILDPTTNTAFPQNQVPASRLNPNAVKLLSLYPLPNFQGPGTINYTSASPSWQRYRQDLTRVDHNFTPSHKVYVRYIQEPSSIFNPYGGIRATAANSVLPGIAAANTVRRPRNLIVNYASVIRPTFLNEFKFYYGHSNYEATNVSETANRATLGVSIPELYPENAGNLIPAISLGSAYAALSPGTNVSSNVFVFEFANNLTKITGRHVIKMGGLYSFRGCRESNSSRTDGSFSFDTSYTKNPIANLLLGLPYSYTELEKSVWSNVRHSMAEAFIQDDFKVTSQLTLNIGLRYSAFPGAYDHDNNMSNFLPWLYDPARAPRINASNGQLVAGTGDRLNGLILAASTSPYGRRITNSSNAQFGPRFGFAWAPFRRKHMAVRGGYGIYYTEPILGAYMNTSLSNPPYTNQVTIVGGTLADPGAGTTAGTAAPSVIAMDAPLSMPRMQQWSFGVQQEVFKNAVLGVSYVGSHGTQLTRPVNINDPEPGAAAKAGVNVNAVRPYQGYGSITQRQSTGTSIYHSLQVTFNRRMTRHLSAGLAYTYAKSIDIGSTDRDGGDVPPNSRNIRAERGPSDSDRTHVMTANFIWKLPDFTSRGALLKQVANGWQFSGIVRMWSGTPFDVTMSSDVAGIGTTQNQRPNIVAETKGPRTVEEWFNRSAFARPSSYTFGNMGRNSLRGPGVNKWDLSLFKNFTAGEKVRVQFRAELFNAFNHPSFRIPGNALTTTSTGVTPSANNFGVITNTRDARVMQLVLRTTF
jgi:hypothetical protein